MMFIDR